MADQVELARRALDSVSAARRFAPQGAAVLGGLAALLVLLRLRRKARALAPRRSWRNVPPPTRALQAAMRYAERRGVAVPAAMTAREFASAAAATFPAAHEPLEFLVGEHERVRYAQAATQQRRGLRRARRDAERAMRGAGRTPS
jgi:hypothetical protein